MTKKSERFVVSIEYDDKHHLWEICFFGKGLSLWLPEEEWDNLIKAIRETGERVDA